ncbi:hypothetical protein EYF80_019746 [Liparis tanakae]|uniref:Uncharacterized protein n=1 Tax=Liparis tanakae TaxID=230148 RepID=A0A4Z2HX09_9TELE|nr:hypothetical protein EYF80_019746 [Liparis tanakae]
MPAPYPGKKTKSQVQRTGSKSSLLSQPEDQRSLEQRSDHHDGGDQESLSSTEGEQREQLMDR